MDNSVREHVAKNKYRCENLYLRMETRERNTTPWLGAVSNSSSLLQLIKFRRYFSGSRRNSIMVKMPGRSLIF